MFVADNFFLEKYARQLDILKDSYDFQNEAFNFPEAITKYEMEQINFVDIVNIEDYEKLRNGLHKLYKKHQKSSYSMSNSYSIDEFFFNTKSKINLNHWSRVLTIKKIEYDINKYFDQIDVSLLATSHSHIEVLVSIKVSNQFNEKILSLIKSDEDKRYVRYIPPRYKTEFWDLDKWVKTSFNKYTHKKSVIEDEILELKWKIGEYLNKFIPLFFYENNIKVPSLEFYSLSMHNCSLKYSEEHYVLGIGNRRSYSDFNSIGDIEISFENLTSDSTDYSLKIFINCINENRDVWSSKDFSYLLAQELNLLLFSPLIYGKLVEYFEEEFLKINQKYYKRISQRLPDFRKLKLLVNLKIKLDSRLLVFNRIYNSRLEKQFSSINNGYTSFLANENIDKKSYLNKINNITFQKVQSLQNLINQSKSELDENVNFLNSIIDYRRQGRMIFISLITLAVSIIALYISIISIN